VLRRHHPTNARRDAEWAAEAEEAKAEMLRLPRAPVGGPLGGGAKPPTPAEMPAYCEPSMGYPSNVPG